MPTHLQYTLQIVDVFNEYLVNANRPLQYSLTAVMTAVIVSVFSISFAVWLKKLSGGKPKDVLPRQWKHLSLLLSTAE